MTKKAGKNSYLQFFHSAVCTFLILTITLLGSPIVGKGQGAPPSFTGEQIFRGVLFGEDPVAHLFPEVWSSEQVSEQLNTKEKVVAWDAVKEQVVTHVKATDPTFMDEFGVEMQSGEHLRIEAALKEASQKITTAMQSLGAMNSDGSLSTEYQGDMACSVAVVCVAAVAVAVWKWVAVVDVAAVAVVAAVALAIWRYVGRTRTGVSQEQWPSEGNLFRESLIDSIAEKLDSTS